MTDELEVYEPAQQREIRSLSQWVEDASNAHQLAKMLVTTAFVPDSYAGRADQAAAAILLGQELGMSPISALNSVDIIHGRAALRAVALRAVVQANGHEIWVEESTAVRAVVAGRRRGSDKVERSTWTIERAQKLGLAGNDNYRKQPTAMLLARATSECARLIAADAISGIAYSAEELADLGDAAEAVATVPRKTTRVRRQVPAGAVEAPESAEPATEPENAPQTADSAGGDSEGTDPTDSPDSRPALLVDPDTDGYQ